MRVNQIKFFRAINDIPNPKPKPVVFRRFEYIKKGKKLDLFL